MASNGSTEEPKPEPSVEGAGPVAAVAREGKGPVAAGAAASQEDRRVGTLVVDAGPLLRHTALHTLGKKLVTVPGVLGEIRDEAARQRLASYPFPPQPRRPVQSAIDDVMRVARETGHLRYLSAVDLQMMALGLQVAREEGVPGVRPEGHGSKEADEAKAKAEAAAEAARKAAQARPLVPAPAPGKSAWGAPALATPSATGGAEFPSMSSAGFPTLGSAGPASRVAAGPGDGGAAAATAPAQADAAAEAAEEVEEEEEEEAEGCEAGKDTGVPAEPAGGARGNAGAEAAAAAATAGDDLPAGQQAPTEGQLQDAIDECDRETGHWVGPEEVEAALAAEAAGQNGGGIAAVVRSSWGKQRSAHPDAAAAERQPRKVAPPPAAAVITTDFTCQDILVRLGVPLVTLAGRRIRSLRSFAMRCDACFHVITNPKDFGRLFCPACGKDSLRRVATSTTKDGHMRFHTRKNGRPQVRGGNYPLPKPQGGRRGDLLVAEDQLLCGVWGQRARKGQGSRQSYLGDQTLETAHGAGRRRRGNGWGSGWAGPGTAGSGDGPQGPSTAESLLASARDTAVVVGYGRQNPNAQRGRERRGKRNRSGKKRRG